MLCRLLSSCGEWGLPSSCCTGFSLWWLLLKVKVKSLSRIRLFATPWTVAHHVPLSMRFPRQEYWSGLPFPSPGNLLDPEIKPGSPTLQADSLPREPPGKHKLLYSLPSHGAPRITYLCYSYKSTRVGCHFLLQGIFLTQGSNPGLPHCRQTL